MLRTKHSNIKMKFFYAAGVCVTAVHAKLLKQHGTSSQINTLISCSGIGSDAQPIFLFYSL